MPEPNAKQQECPVCHAVVPVDPGYVTWCDSCGWNLSPKQPEGSRGVLAALNVSLGRKQTDALLAYVLRTGARRPTFTWTLLLAMMLSAAVHGTTVGFLLLGLLALVRGWPYLLAIVAGALCIALAWAIRPQFAKVPETLARAEYPRLYELADTIAAVLHAPRVDGIVVDEAFGAAFGQLGWRRKRILYLGLPLWAVLDAQERVALVGHELAHSVNRDPSRGFFIGAALYSLANWYDLLYPRQLWNPRLRQWAFAALPANLLLWAVSGVVWLVASLLQLLLWRDTQRAEYLADRLAAEASGTAAALSVLQKLHLGQTYVATMRQTALNPDRSGDFFAEFQRAIGQVPPRELERVRRVTQMEMTRLDTTHPPTTCRIKALDAHHVECPQVGLPAADSARIDAEMERLKGPLERKLVDRYRATLYHRYY